MNQAADDEFWKDDLHASVKRERERQTGQRLPPAATGPVVRPPAPIEWATLDESVGDEYQPSLWLSLGSLACQLCAVLSFLGGLLTGPGIFIGLVSAAMFGCASVMLTSVATILQAQRDLMQRLDRMERNQRIIANARR